LRSQTDSRISCGPPCPDNELFLQAKENKLGERSHLKQQVLRLLDDPRSESFIHGFAESWLRLDKLGTMPPASLKFREYYRYGLKEAMLEETHQFLTHAVHGKMYHSPTLLIPITASLIRTSHDITELMV